MLLYWSAAVLLIAGILVLLDVRPLRWIPKPRYIKQQLIQFWQWLRSRRRVSLKNKVYKILGRKRDNVFVRTMGEALQTLERTGEKSKAKRMERSCIFFSLGGICIGLLLQNPFLVPVLGAGLYFIPLWLIKLSFSAYLTHLNDELEIALSQITSSYISNGNTVTAVKENLQYLNPPVYDAFERFVYTVEFVDPSCERALEKLRDSFDSYIFKEWCNAMLQCQRDNSLKSTLQPHVNKFSRQKYMQEKQRTGQMIPFRDYAIMCALVPACVFGLAMFSPEWFAGLITNPVGQITISASVIVIIVGLNKAVEIAMPYQLRR